MIGVDLFAGAGGMSIGASAAGVNVHAAVELNRHASATYRANHPGVELCVGDIRGFEPPNLRRRDEPLVVFGGPPCSGFSTSNQRTRSRTNPSNWLFLEFIRVVRILNPEWVVVENVKGILETEGGAFVRAIRDELSTLGYMLTQKVLNAAHFGVPQRRARLFIVGRRGASPGDLPDTNGTPEVTVDAAIGDLPALANGAAISRLPYASAPRSRYAAQLRGELIDCANHLVTRNAPHIVARYSHIPQGGNWETIPPELMDTYSDPEGCHTGIYHRLRADQPAKVIGNFRKNMLIHPLQDRGLSVREAARLQSFPDNHEFCGSIGFQQQQVGNAVPPLLAHAVFSHIVDSEGRRPGSDDKWI